MLKIDDKQNIFITRGDTGIISLTLKEPNSPYSEYSLEEHDIALLTVKKNIDGEILIAKVFEDNEIKFDSLDTKNLDYGEYIYDVQVHFANGDINTVIPYTVGCLTKFFITKEVTL